MDVELAAMEDDLQVWADEAPSDAPAWQRVAVCNGLQALLSLHLPGAPAAETIVPTAEVWLNALAEELTDFSLDAPRLGIAFQRLTAEAVKFPAPANLRAVMPSRYASPAREPSAAEIQARIEHRKAEKAADRAAMEALPGGQGEAAGRLSKERTRAHIQRCKDIVKERSQ